MTNSNPKISIIIPFYNAGNTIEETMESVLNQNYNNFDVWVVDDGSTDEFSKQVLNQYESNSRVNILRQENSGPAIARNNAIKQSRAEFIVALDADDKIRKNALAVAMPLMLNADVDVVYGDIQFFGKSNQLKQQEVIDIKTMLLWNQVAMCAVIRKSVFEKCGFFDEFLSKPGLEDWEFWIRALSNSVQFCKVDEVLFDIRVDELSRTYQVANKNLDQIKEYVFKKHLSLYLRNYNELYYHAKMLQSSPAYRIGNFILKPMRFLKKAIGL